MLDILNKTCDNFWSSFFNSSDEAVSKPSDVTEQDETNYDDVSFSEGDTVLTYFVGDDGVAVSEADNDTGSSGAEYQSEADEETGVPASKYIKLI